MEQQWKRVEYETWDAAFKGLVPLVRQQSVRVAAYARELYVHACSLSFARKFEGQERIHGRYADVAYKCGMYHQLGKALVPPEYQLWQEDFKEEEEQLYKKYTSDGRILVSTLQVRGAKSRFWKKEAFEEQPTENIPWLMIRESCQQHMERWDGSGYPDGRKAEEISPIAQIVGLARELDVLASGTVSETPFDEAFAMLCSQEGTLWNPELIQVLKAAEASCREVYNKYIHYTLTLPKTITLVERSADRSMGLSYRAIQDSLEGHIWGYEATPWFSGIANRPGEIERLDDVASMLKSTDIANDVANYFMYEAADTVLRMGNCKLDEKKILLQVPNELYTQGSKLKEFNQLFEDQPIEKDNLLLLIPEQLVKNANKGVREVIARYVRNGIVMVMDQFHPAAWEPEELKETAISYLRLSPDVAMEADTAESIEILKTWGFTILATGVDSQEMREWMFHNGVAGLSGPITGNIITEDELIRDGIMRQQQ